GFGSRIEQELGSTARWQGLIAYQHTAELFDLATTTDAEIVRGKALDGRNTGYPIDETGPERLHPLTDGAYNPHPCNSNTVTESDGIVRRPDVCSRRHRNCTTGRGPVIHSAPTRSPSVAALSPHDHALQLSLQ